MLSYTTLSRRGRVQCPTIHEQAEMAGQCIVRLESDHRLGAQKEALALAFAFTKGRDLCHWYVRTRTRDAFIYDPTWVAKSIQRSFPQTESRGNAWDFAMDVLEESFPMHWDSWRNAWGECLNCWSLLSDDVFTP